MAVSSSTSKKTTSRRAPAAKQQEASSAVKNLEARCDQLEKSLSAAVSQNVESAKKIQLLEEVVAALSSQSSSTKDPRVDELISKLRILVSKCRGTRGRQSTPWPRF